MTTSAIASYLAAVPSVDEVGVGERVAALGTRSIKKSSKRDALLLAVRMMDLTTLEGKDTPGKVAQLCAKGIRPDPVDPSVPPVARDLRLPQPGANRPRGAGRHLGQGRLGGHLLPQRPGPLEVKLDETKRVVAMGADEVDMVIDRGAFLAGRHLEVFEEIAAVKEACGPAHLKVILETGELGTLDAVRRPRCWRWRPAPTSSRPRPARCNRRPPSPVGLVMLEAIRDFERLTGVAVGMKPAGGIRVSKDAIKWLVMVHETLGPDWLTPDRFRIGASSLLNDVLMQLRWLATGRYQSPDYFTEA